MKVTGTFGQEYHIMESPDGGLEVIRVQNEHERRDYLTEAIAIAEGRYVKDGINTLRPEIRHILALYARCRHLEEQNEQ